MSQAYCKSKVHQTQFRLRLRPKPSWGSLQRSTSPLSGFPGILPVRGGTGSERDVGRESSRKVEAEGREGEEGEKGKEEKVSAI